MIILFPNRLSSPVVVLFSEIKGGGSVCGIFVLVVYAVPDFWISPSMIAAGLARYRSMSSPLNSEWLVVTFVVIKHCSLQKLKFKQAIEIWNSVLK